MVMVECPVCGVKGHLQVRGNSARVGHYVGCSGSTRMVEWHTVDASVITGNHSSVIRAVAAVTGDMDKARIGVQQGFKERNGLHGGGLVDQWYDRLTCNQEVGGSNPPQSTNNSIERAGNPRGPSYPYPRLHPAWAPVSATSSTTGADLEVAATPARATRLPTL